MNVYFTATYKDATLRYAGVLIKDDGVRTCTNGQLAGSEPETMVSAVGIALEQAKKANEPICFYTDLEDAVKWASGERKPIAKRIKDFVKYVKKTEEAIGLTFERYIPDEVRPELERVALSYRGEKQSETNPFVKKTQAKTNWGNWGDGWKQATEENDRRQSVAASEPSTNDTPSYAIPKPYKGAMWGGFRVTVYDAKGKLMCDLDQNDFGQKNLADAVFFADWYERESKNPDSYFYGVKVEKYNVPARKITESKPKRKVKIEDKTEDKSFEQLSMESIGLF